jgi:DNA-binding response OmpR family regulator
MACCIRGDQRPARAGEADIRLLVIEDEERIASFIQNGLSEEGYVVDVVADGVDGLSRAREGVHDLIVLDLMLPGMDGLAVLRSLREAGGTVPVLVLTARDSVDDKVTGLDLGADDYLTKPFAFDELLARIRALLRRDTAARTSVLDVGPLSLDLVSHTARVAGEEIELTPREFSLLEYFMSKPGAMLSRTRICQHVWGSPHDESNVVDVYVNYLRKKIEGAGGPRMIHTVRGQGYVLRPPDQKT